MAMWNLYLAFHSMLMTNESEKLNLWHLYGDIINMLTNLVGKQF
jgi:hypothetical protein